MSKLKVLQEPHKLLRGKAEDIDVKRISSAEIRGLLKNMSETLCSIDIGIGLAAPQIGKPWRIFIVSEEVFSAIHDTELIKEGKEAKKWKHLVFINPKLLKSSKRTKSLPEGCLSVENIFGEVKRSEKVTVEAYDEKGRKFNRGASGLFAQAIQHEIDHLNGILFIDKASKLKKIEIDNAE
jgi:peptide deformylase